MIQYVYQALQVIVSKAWKGVPEIQLIKASSCIGLGAETDSALCTNTTALCINAHFALIALLKRMYVRKTAVEAGEFWSWCWAHCRHR